GARPPSALPGVVGQIRPRDERAIRSGGRKPQRAATTRRAAVTSKHHASAVIEFPNELEILITRQFEAPIALVFDVFTKPEHVRKTFAPFGEAMAVCSIDLRVGGSYHFFFVPKAAYEMSFRGTYLEVEPPTRTVQTW